MDMTALGLSIFNALPTGTKGVVTFGRQTGGTFNPVTDTTVGFTTTTWTAQAVFTSPHGTDAESYEDQLSVRTKFVELTVLASGLARAPLAGDTVTIPGGESLVVVGINPVKPDGTNVAIYTVACERVS